jgi:lipopolysaccharide biosynthesis glycosyltransferase
MYSLKENKHRDVNYDVYLLCIEFNDIEKINTLNSDDFCIHPIYIKKNIFVRKDNAGIVYYKLLLHELLDCDSVFHIDADTVVIGDISEIFEIDMKDYFVAGVRDKINGIDYFNAGNILLNLKKIRHAIINEKDTMYSYYVRLESEANDYRFWEQDIMNDAFKGYVKYINYGYNFLTNNYGHLKFNEYIRIYGERIKSERIKIIHYASVPKPWIKADLFGKIWEMYANKTVDKKLEKNILRMACREYKK